MQFFRQDKTLYEKKSGDMTVQVIQRDNRRELRFGNHITQSAISLSHPDVLQLDYTRAMMAAFLFVPQAANILHIGLGAGSLPRFIHHHFPQSKQVLVEVSAEVIEVAFRYFQFPVSPRLQVVEDEGERYLHSADSRFDLIFLDAFHAEGVSQHLESEAFFGNLRDHLTPGGWLVNNVWGSDRANLDLVRLNLATLFPRMYSLSVRADSNVIFFAAANSTAPSSEALIKRAETLSRETGIDLERLAERLKIVHGDRESPASMQG
jgi:spermidine synthase